MASSRNRDPVAWGVICFLTGIIGIIVLALLGTNNDPRVNATSEAEKSRDALRWRTLVEVDPEIAAAAAEARKISPLAEQALAEKYLAINDKTYLGAILMNVLANPPVPTNGQFKGVNYRLLPSGAVVVTKGRNVGKAYNSYDDMVKDVS